jgi:hypothetical protein
MYRNDASIPVSCFTGSPLLLHAATCSRTLAPRREHPQGRNRQLRQVTIRQDVIATSRGGRYSTIALIDVVPLFVAVEVIMSTCVIGLVGTPIT